MPAIVDKITLADPFLKRNCKLLPCQREMVAFWYARGTSIHSIAKRFKVSRRLIQFVLFPDRQVVDLENRRKRGGSKIYYNKVEHTAAMADHRNYKKKFYDQSKEGR